MGPDISQALGGTGDSPVPPGHWPGGMSDDTRDKDGTPPDRVSPSFRPASRRPAQASGLCYPVRAGSL